MDQYGILSKSVTVSFIEQRDLNSFLKNKKKTDTFYKVLFFFLPSLLQPLCNICCILCCPPFPHLFEGRCFYIYSDHKLLLGAFQAKADTHSPREVRPLDFLLQFTSNIRLIKGEENIPADAFSRSINTLQLRPDIDAQVIASEQQKDINCSRSNNRSLQL